jgi:hypothetical protein
MKGDRAQMLSRKALSVVLGVLFLLSLGFAAVAEEKVLLQYNPKPGTAAKYKLGIKGITTVTAMDRAQKTDLETQMTLEQKVTGVDKDGNLSITTTIMDGQIVVNKTPTQLPAVGQVITVKMAKNGEVLSSEGADQSTNFQQMQIKFPEKPVGIGDTWSTTINPNPQLPIPLEVKYTVQGFETVSGYKCVKLQSRVTTSQGDAGSINLNVEADGKIWFAYEDGIMVKNEVTSNMVMVMTNDLGSGKKEKIDTRMNLTMRMNLVK